MRKVYPYLQDSYLVTEDMNESAERRNFLAKIDDFVNQKQYVNITLLDWHENPIKEIQGELTSGSITKDGTSSIRRTGNFQCSVNGTEYSVEDGEMDFAINKKIFIEIGVRNDTGMYKDWKTLWFPQGVFFIGAFNITSSATSSVNISISLKDKMAGLNGDVGGKFPATTVLDEMETQTPSGEFVTEKVKLYNLIQEVVNHWGGEDINNIVIDDVPLRIRRVMKWTGDTPLWLVPEEGTSAQAFNLWYHTYTTPPSDYYDKIEGPTKKKFLTYEDYWKYVREKYQLDNPDKSIEGYTEKMQEIIDQYNQDIQEPSKAREEMKTQLQIFYDTGIMLDGSEFDWGLTIDVNTYGVQLEIVEATDPYGVSKEPYLDIIWMPDDTPNLENIGYTQSKVRSKVEVYNSYVDDIRRYDVELRKLEQIKNSELAKLTGYIENIKKVTVDETTGEVEVEEGDSVIQEIDWELTDETLQITNGTDAGYIYDDFYYTGELVMNAGQTVVDALEAIKSYLGNYEYFYDEFGVFHFQEIKNYLNTTQGKIVLTDMEKKDYLVETTLPKSIYTFSDDTNLISITSNPQYENIKNDYIIEGKRQAGSSDFVYPVRYHLAIDRKPIPGSEFKDLLLYTEELTNMVKAAFPLHVDELPLPGNFNVIYELDGSYYFWENNVYKDVDVVQYYGENNPYITEDWRTELYLQGMLAKNLNTSAGNFYNDLSYKSISAIIGQGGWIGNIYEKVYTQRLDIDFYFEELDAFWPQIYNLEKQQFIGFAEDATLHTSSLADGIYYLDFIDPNTSGLGEYSVSNIGRRSNVVVDEEINCLFAPSIPDIIFLNTDDENIAELREECIRNGQPFTQVSGDIYYSFATGGHSNDAYTQMKYELLVHTNYQKTVSIMALPAFYLEPNTRVTLNDKSTNTYGDYIISTITIPLGSGNMSVTGSECFEKF